MKWPKFYAEETQQHWQQSSRFHSDGLFFLLGFFLAPPLAGCLEELMLLSAILLRRNEQRNNNPPRSVDPLDCDSRQFSRMELSSRLPVLDRPDEEAAVNRRNSSLLDKAATMASSNTSFRLR